MELIVALIFGSVVSLGAAIATFGRRPEQRRLDRLASGEGHREVDSSGVLTSGELGWFARLMRIFAGDAAKRGEPSLAPIQRRLTYAGFRGDSALVTYMGSRIALGLALPVLLLMTPLAWSLDRLQLVMALCTASGLGLIGPSYWLDQQVKKRQRAIEIALPDALDLMVVCVEAGLGINASMKRVAEDFRTSHPILAAEFELTNFERRAGKSTSEALRALAERTGVSDISSLVAMLIQTERFGTSLADTLRVHADGMRLRRLQRAEEQANKAPLKMLFPTVFIFAAMLVIVVGPGLLAFGQYFGARK